jgi:hypothetical protein
MIHTQNVDQALVQDLEKRQEVQNEESEDGDCDLILWFVVEDLWRASVVSLAGD